MLKKLTVAAIALAGLGSATAANAVLYEFNGTVTLCTGTCDSFASLDVGTQINGIWEIDVQADGTWGFVDVIDFGAEVFNPGAPVEPFDGTNPTTANPLPLLPSVAPVAAAGGGLTTGGGTNATGQLENGTILHEFVVPPFNSNAAWVVFDIGLDGAATAQVCLFFPTAGCIPGATQAVVIEGQFTVVPVPAAVWLFGSALLGLVGLRHRKA